jgi:predicted nucleic acid-binding Zn ribbon protein
MFLNPLERILNKVIQQPEWKNYRQYRQIIECWQQVVNQQVLKNTKPLYQEREILYVATSSAVWAQELSLQRYFLVKKLNNQLSFTLKDIRFSPASWHHKPKQEVVKIPLPEINLQKYKTETEPNIDAKTAVESWLNNIKSNSQNLATCPQCQSLTTQAELTRWGVCRYCIAQKWHSEYRPSGISQVDE